MSQRAAPPSGRESRDDGAGEQSIELRRQIDALRRSRWLILSLVVVTTALTVGLSLLLPKSYTASTELVFDQTADPLSQPDAESVQRQLATISSLVTTPGVLDDAASRLKVSRKDLEKRVQAAVDSTANIISIEAKADDAAAAAATANTVADVFLAQQRAFEKLRSEAARSRILEEIARLRGRPNSALEIEALQQRLSELSVSEASSGASLRIASPAEAPEGPSSPKPVRNGILAFFGALFIGILLALGRDQLVPRIGSARELSRITDRPVLVSIPYARQRIGRNQRVLSGVEQEAYSTLQATIRFQLPPDEQHVILVTSAIEREGKTTVSTNLGRALARAGRKTLLISADLRKPKLHERVGIPLSPGFAEALAALERDDDSSRERTVTALRSLLGAHTEQRGNLHILASGKRPSDPARLLLSPALPAFLREARALGYEYILFDGPPLLGLADSQALAQRVDDVLVVTRFDRSTTDDAVEVRETLERLDVTPLGNVVVGVRRGVSYYYAADVPELN